MKRKKFLDFYLEHIKYGELPFAGICCCFDEDEEAINQIDLFEPTHEEAAQYGHGVGWWGRVVGKETLTEFTPFRQNVILFLAAMNDEL